jgi:RNA polymerase sigma-70 factor (ECF subfamily)
MSGLADEPSAAAPDDPAPQRATDDHTTQRATDDVTAKRAAEQIAVLRCQLGDEGAFETLYDRYSNQVFYYLRRLLGGSEQAEDALQEVWLTVYRRVATLNNPGAFKAWLFRIAHNRAISILRKSGRWVALDELPDDAGGDIATIVESPSDEGIDDEDVARVHAALDRLAPVHRDVLTLRFMGELSYAEIAEVTGCALGTVKSRIHHAKAALRQALRGLDEVEGGASAPAQRTNEPARMMLTTLRSAPVTPGSPALATVVSVMSGGNDR